jgi:hypothetical protein
MLTALLSDDGNLGRSPRTVVVERESAPSLFY